MIRMILHLLAALITTLCTGFVARAQTPGLQPADSIPFELGTGRDICIDLKINNDDTPLRFLFDTGATENVVNARSERALRTLQFTDSMKISGTDSQLSYPRTGLDNSILVGATRMEGGIRFIKVALPDGFDYDGICGIPLFLGMDFSIDYDRRHIYLYNMGESVPGEEYAQIPLQMLKNGLYAARLDIGYGPLSLSDWFTLDSGSDGSITFSAAFVREHGMENVRQPWFQTQATGISGGRRDIEFIFLDSMALGGYTLYKVPAALNIEDRGDFASSPTAGSIGNNLLQRFNQIWCPLSGKLYITPNNRLYTPFYDSLIGNR